MARIKFGPMVTNISGSVGSLTIQRGKFGNIARLKPMPRPVGTSAQASIWRKIAYIQHAWQDLTDAQRLQWDRFMSFNNASINRDRNIRLSGHALYIKYQLFHIIANQPLYTVFQYVPMPDIVQPDAIQISGNYYYLHFPSSIVPEEFFFQFKVSPPRQASRSFYKRGLRYMLIGWGSGTSFDFKTPYLDAFGVGFSVGDTLHYTIQFFSILSPVYTGVYTGKMVVTTP